MQRRLVIIVGILVVLMAITTGTALANHGGLAPDVACERAAALGFVQAGPPESQILAFC